jgi:hypothetical protein
VIPVASGVKALVETEGWQLWQSLPGLSAVEPYTLGPTTQPNTQLPHWQKMPPPAVQLLPSGMALKPVVLTVGWQLWQTLAGFGAASA